MPFEHKSNTLEKGKRDDQEDFFCFLSSEFDTWEVESNSFVSWGKRLLPEVTEIWLAFLRDLRQILCPCLRSGGTRKGFQSVGGGFGGDRGCFSTG